MTQTEQLTFIVLYLAMDKLQSSEKSWLRIFSSCVQLLFFSRRNLNFSLSQDLLCSLPNCPLCYEEFLCSGDSKHQFPFFLITFSSWFENLFHVQQGLNPILYPRFALQSAKQCIQNQCIMFLFLIKLLFLIKPNLNYSLFTDLTL